MNNDSTEFTPEQVEQQIDLLARSQRLWSNPSPDARLISDLYQVCAEENTLLESAWQHLAERVGITSQEPVAGNATMLDRSQIDTQAVWRKGSHIMQIETMQKRPIRRFQRLLGLCAALLLVTVLVGGMVVVLNSARQSARPFSPANAGATTPTPALPEGQVIYQSEHLSLSSPLAWSPDGTRVAAVVDHTAKSWDALTGKHVLEYRPGGTASPFRTTTVVWSPDGSTLAVVDSSSISLFNARNTQLLRSFSPSQALGEQTPSQTATSGPALSSLFPHSGCGLCGIEDTAWSPDGKDVSAYTNNGVYIWDAQNGSLVKHLNNVFLFNNVNSVRELWQPHGHLLATIECRNAACLLTQVSLWDTTTWSVVKQYPDIYTFDWSPDGSQLALVSATRMSVFVVDARTGQQVKQITDPHSFVIIAVHWSPDGSRLALGTMASLSSTTVNIGIWSTVNGKRLYAFPHSNCSGARWSPDSKYLSCIQSEETGSGNQISSFEQILIWVA